MSYGNNDSNIMRTVSMSFIGIYIDVIFIQRIGIYSVSFLVSKIYSNKGFF